MTRGIGHSLGRSLSRRGLMRAGAGAAVVVAGAESALAQTTFQGGAQGTLSSGAELDPTLWRNFAERFVLADGRVVDTGNGRISHSEGQGYGLVLAAAARDRATFDRVWTWTKRTLLVRPDGLAAWKWVESQGVTDSNNATDGDLLIAWGLLRGAELWRDDGLKAAGLALGRSVREQAVIKLGGSTVLLPGVTGFRRGAQVVINPSYLVVPALQALAAAEPSGPWNAVIESGLVMLVKARFGQWQLPPDWALMAEDGSVTLPDGFEKRFSYDAIRVPLYLAWGGYRDPYYFRPFGAYAARFQGGPIPATVSLPGSTTAQVPASVGMLAVLRLASRLADTGNTVTVPPPAAGEDYYSSVLNLMTKVAERKLGLPATD